MLVLNMQLLFSVVIKKVIVSNVLNFFFFSFCACTKKIGKSEDFNLVISLVWFCFLCKLNSLPHEENDNAQMIMFNSV